MGKGGPWLLLVALCAVLLGASVHHPQYLSDRNEFLRDFLDVDFLSILAFIVSVTIASTSSIHLHLNGLTDSTNIVFNNVRISLKRSAISLIICFLLALALVVVKPLVRVSEVSAAIANSAAIVIMYFNMSVLFDITKTVFAIPSAKEIKDRKLALNNSSSGASCDAAKPSVEDDANDE